MPVKELSFSKNAIYNTVGTLISGFSLWLTTLVVVRFSNDYTNAGIWQLAISVTNIFATIAIFNLATFYVSDVENKYSSEQYIATQMVTCILSVLLCTVYALTCGYRGVELTCIIAYMIARAIEAFAGFLFGIEQRNYRMDYVGISFSLRGIFDIIAFTLALYLTQNLVLASLSMAIVTFIVLLIYDMPRAKQFVPIKPKFDFKNNVELLEGSILSVVAIALFTAINTIPRQFLESMHGEENLGYYATIAAPIVVVQVVAISIFNPILRDVSVGYSNNDFAKLKSIAIKVLMFLLGLALVGLLGAKLLGEFAYTIIYGEAIRPYCYLMYAAVGCTVLYAACWACWNMLIVMRKTKVMLVLSMASVMIAILLSRFFITTYFLNGISYIIILVYALFFIFSSLYIVIKIKRKIINI